MISHFPLSHSVRVISWVLHWREFCFCRQNALPNANSLHGSRTSADLSLPVGGNGRLYGITTVKQRCPSGYNKPLLWAFASFAWHFLFHSRVFVSYFVFLDLSHFCSLSPLCCFCIFSVLLSSCSSSGYWSHKFQHFAWVFHLAIVSQSLQSHIFMYLNLLLIFYIAAFN